MMEQLAYPLTSCVNSFIRYENLEDDLVSVLKSRGADTSSLTLPLKNLTPGKRKYQEYYSVTSRTFVEAVFAEPLAKFGHRFQDDPVT